MSRPTPLFRQLPGFDARAARVIWTAALTLLLLAVVYAIRGTLFIFVVSLLFAYLLYPLVHLISGKFSPKHRSAVLALTYLLVLGTLIAGVIGIGSPVAAEARLFADHPPDVREFLANLRLNYPFLSPAIDSVQTRIRELSGEILSALPRFSLHVLAASANLLDLVIIPILSFFMVKDGPEIRRSFLDRFPAGVRRTNAERNVDAVHALLQTYMRAVLLLCCCVLVVFSVVLSAMGVPYALLLSSVAFLCEFVPLLGSLTAAAAIIMVSALSGYPHVWWVIAFLGVFRLLQDYVISPKVMGRGLELHPMLVIFGVFAGAEIAGVAGVFLSIPALALARLAFRGPDDKAE